MTTNLARPDRKTLGQIIARRREEVGMRQADLARRLKVDPVRVWRIEHGAMKLGLEDILPVLAALGWSLHDLAFQFDSEPMGDRAPVVEDRSEKDKMINRLASVAASMADDDLRMLVKFTKTLAVSLNRTAAP